MAILHIIIYMYLYIIEPVVVVGRVLVGGKESRPIFCLLPLALCVLVVGCLEFI